VGNISRPVWGGICWRAFFSLDVFQCFLHRLHKFPKVFHCFCMCATGTTKLLRCIINKRTLSHCFPIEKTIEKPIGFSFFIVTGVGTMRPFHMLVSRSPLVCFRHMIGKIPAHSRSSQTCVFDAAFFTTDQVFCTRVRGRPWYNWLPGAFARKLVDLGLDFSPNLRALLSFCTMQA